MEKLLEKTKMLDYDNPSIQSLIKSRGWNNLDEFNKIKAIYDFVRDEILFGYNTDDSLSASMILKALYQARKLYPAKTDSIFKGGRMYSL